MNTCVARRERRRKVDADKDHGRRHRGNARHHAARRQACLLQDAGRSVAPRRHHGLPGNQPGTVHDGRPEPLSRRRKIVQPFARHLHRRANLSQLDEFQRRSLGHGVHAGGGEKADGRDRARGPSECACHHFRRAHGVTHSGRKISLFLLNEESQETRRVDRFHFPCFGGSAAKCRPHQHSEGR